MANTARWRAEDCFPSSQVWADEAERVLSFLSAHDQFERFLPRLRDTAKTRDAAYAEARVAFFLHRVGFKITDWEPTGTNKKKGEFSIKWNDGPAIFVEVKVPSWQGELSQCEKLGERKTRGKFIDLEGRVIYPFRQVEWVVQKNIIPKLAADRPNLAIIADDLFCSPTQLVDLQKQLDSLFARSGNDVLGALLFFKADLHREHVEYNLRYYENPYALASCRIPGNVAVGLANSSLWDKARMLKRVSI